MEQILIKTDTRKKELQLRLIAERKELIKKIENYFDKYELKYTDSADIEEDFKTKFIEKYQDEYPAHVTPAKMFELSEVNENLLHQFERKLNDLTQQIELNDPNIYLDNSEQLGQWKTIENLIQVIQDFQEKNIHYLSPPQNVWRSLAAFIELDEQGKIIPRIDYIKNNIPDYSRCF